MDVVLAAQEPALGMWRDQGFEPVAFNAPRTINVESMADLVEQGKSLLDGTNPEVIATGLSGPDAGIDEAMHQVASVATFAIQDFWGDVNLSLPRRPSVVCVIDEEAARLTRQRCDCEIIVAGSTKHALFARLDVAKLRERGRKRASADVLVVGLFLQPLSHVPGYMSSVLAAVTAVASMVERAILVVRAHPKALDLTALLLSAVPKGSPHDELRIVDASPWPYEETLLACDVVLTATSSVVSDVLGFARVSGSNPPAIVNVLAPAVLADFRSYGALERLPTSVLDLANEAEADAKSILGAIDRGLSKARKADIAKRLRSVIPDGRRAPDTIIDAMIARVESRGAST
jgi:hypothetical protein